jgi:uncharacterized 2Fe-2S/4Fe-4S cluster protein (DUF4445 family)
MPRINFKPLGKSIEVPTGTELLDAARQAGIDIDFPCGGKGTCGKCVLRIVSGETETNDHGTLSASAIDRGYVLACQTKVLQSPLNIEIPKQSSKEGGQFVDETDETCLARDQLFPPGYSFQPLTQKLFLEVSEPRLEDGLSDLDRLTRTIEQQLGEGEVIYPLPVIRQVAEALRQEDGKMTVYIAKETRYLRVIHIAPGHSKQVYYGLAVDIGTTTVAVQLVELPSAKVIATQTTYNKQIQCGLDVISRINYARRPERLIELRDRVLETINHLTEQLCSGNDINQRQIYSIVLAGNTTMVHLLLALPPEYIRLEPYTPTLLKSPYFTAKEIGLQVHPLAAVYISPSVGSYVGGDITAGLLCADIAREREEISLFLDIGTNGELVVGNNDFLMTCACSAGPAFEGGGIETGMRAALGAIDKVEVNIDTGIANYQTIGNVPAKGICGTGMISLLADLFQKGWLDAAGKLNRTKPSPAIQIDGRQARYIIVPAEERNSNNAIYINETDIDNIIRAKAAIYAACSLMLHQVGMAFDDLTNIFIAGGFGRFLDIEKAIVIGLLPDLPRETFQYIGNSSLMGAYMLLVSKVHREQQSALAQRMTYVELSTDPDYMDQFTGACFLPHTDSRKFPSVSSL